ncbi:integrase/recombinase XerD [Methanococcus maripaludis]|uniref:Integrase/recombinase XerD n=1 Tax=Methanococcus maripaludis TaxID=39152 RepID=A0A7J9NV38_METMI|nr:tyrosine-type recombinase/integrase [Methanococcus maripaludis]MBA2851540.1 integrase/recombinase XerD [Methanococcus maripaludis]
MKNIENLILFKPEKRKAETNEKIEEILEFYRVERDFDGIKPATIKGDTTRLRVVLDFVYNSLEKDLKDLENADFVKFFNYLEKERNVSRHTLNHYFNLLKIFFRIMRLKNFKSFEEETKERGRYSKFEVKHYDAVNREQLNDILKSVLDSTSGSRIRDTIIIRTLWDTGARVTEVLNLNVGDIDHKEGVIKLTNTKGKEERLVIVSEEVLELIKHLIEHNRHNDADSPIFQSRTGDRLYNGRISQVFRDAVNELKNKGKLPKNRKIVIHSLRHGRAVELLNSGLGIDIVKEYLGHKSIETTLYYSHSKERQKVMLKNIRKML